MNWEVKLVQDSFKELKYLPDNTYDVTITDPPYSEHVHQNLCSGSLVGTKKVPKYSLKFDPLRDYGWLQELVRVTKRWVVVFCALEDFGRFEMAVGRKIYVRSCVMYKPNSMGQLTKDRPATSYEGIALLHSSGVKKRWNGRGSYGIWKCNGTRGKKGRHPNEKHPAMALKLTALFSEAGETVFDPFCGSGAFGEAAKRLGRRYEGWDNDPEWVDKASARIINTADQWSDVQALDLCHMNSMIPEVLRKAKGKSNG